MAPGLVSGYVGQCFDSAFTTGALGEFLSQLVVTHMNMNMNININMLETHPSQKAMERSKADMAVPNGYGRQRVNENTRGIGAQCLMIPLMRTKLRVSPSLDHVFM